MLRYRDRKIFFLNFFLAIHIEFLKNVHLEYVSHIQFGH